MTNANQNTEVMLIEGDPSNPDVAPVYLDQANQDVRYPGVNILYSDLLTQSGWDDMIDEVEKQVPKRIVSTLPAHAGKRLHSAEGEADDDEKTSELFSEYTDMLRDMGYQVVHLFVLGPDEEPMRLYKESVENGLAGMADHRVVVLNEAHGPHETFQWMVHSDSPRADLIKNAGCQESVLPNLDRRTMNQLKCEQKMPYFEPVRMDRNDPRNPLTKVGHNRLWKWWGKVNAMLAEIEAQIGGEMPENVAVIVDSIKGGAGKSLMTKLVLDRWIENMPGPEPEPVAEVVEEAAEKG